ncbi:MAG: LysR family transcriptional regulator [Aromatoleum sp.]|jgi:DNA-binding transcriptional LysR family regulator|uniref:LysR family transcriptional regulator n=1 Tax=Aromatoleum sp. TaxID=2307007 RepID=UPI002894A6C7|nr:LysR family transcriptional regulator [Aromatoleum sp.]MDT3671268.1 LysR family transcriptional regulator [Aromatoleum sp.]
MRGIELKDLDLNLLVVFLQLLRDGRVTTAAEALELSQPGVSSALNRLRRILGDDLFYRTGSGMRPTPYAEELAAPIAEALALIASTVNQRSTFDPLTSSRSFVIAMTDVGEIFFLPSLMRTLSKFAPNVRISTVRNSRVNLKEEMEDGKVDLAIGLLPDLKSDFYQRRLFQQGYSCVFRGGHPLDGAPVGVEDFVAAEHVVVVSAGTGHGKTDETIERAVQRNVRMRIPHFVALPYILSETNLIASLPEKIATRLASSFSLRSVPHPLDLPQIQINLFWHAKFHHEAGNQWLRTLIFETFSE